MANDFKAAAARKKRNAEARKARDLNGQVEAFLQEQGESLADEAKAELQSVAEKLKAVIEDTGVEAETIISERESAEAAFHAVAEKLNGQSEEAPPAEEKEDAPAETTVEEPVKAQEDASPAEELVAEEKAAEEDLEGEKIADVLRRMYAAPRYSRVDGETKVRFNGLIKPSLRNKMEEDRKAGNIKSPNDLINVLLEIYYGEE